MKGVLFGIACLLAIHLGCSQSDTGDSNSKTFPPTKAIVGQPRGLPVKLDVSDFKTFTSKAGRFTADFPGDPTPSEQAVDTSVGKATNHSFQCRVGNEFEFLAMYNDLPGGFPEAQIKSFNADAALDGIRDGIARQTNTRVLKAGKITFDKWPGREWELAATAGMGESFRWRCYYANTRLYQISVGWRKGHEPPKEVADKFLNSLKILAE